VREPPLTSTEPPCQVPPHNLGAERQVLGGMIVSPEAVPTAVAIVGRDSFYDPRHRIIFGAIYTLWERDQPIDAVSVAAQLRQSGDFDAAGGGTKLAELVNAVAKPSAEYVAFHAGLVREAAALRRIIDLASEAKARALQSGADPGALVTRLATELEELAPKAGRGEIIGPGITLAQLRAKDPKLPPFLVNGLLFCGGEGRSGNTGLLSGPPASSKTWAGLQLAKAVAEGTPWFGVPTTQARVVLFELEMSEAEIEPRCKALDKETGEAWRENVVLFSKDQIPGGQLDVCDTRPW